MFQKYNSKLGIIAAMDASGGVGIDQRLPWSLPEDLKRFQALTSGCPIVMGRKTFESLGKPLPRRKHLVMSRDVDWSLEIKEKFPDIEVLPSWEAVLAWVAENRPHRWFAIGGPAIWELAIHHADRLYFTFVDGVHEVDTKFPYWNKSEWVEDEKEVKDGFSFVDYRKQNGVPFLTWIGSAAPRLVSIDELIDHVRIKPHDETVSPEERYLAIRYAPAAEHAESLIWESEQAAKKEQAQIGIELNAETEDLRRAQWRWVVERWPHLKHRIV